MFDLMTRIVNDWPPNIKSIRAVLPVTENNIFAYGGTIYNPGGRGLSRELIAHETVHFRQQAEFKKPRWSRNSVESWWKKFLAEPEFRLEQELEAHREEYQEYCRRNKDRNRQVLFARLISKRLAAPMYGGLITAPEAQRKITALHMEPMAAEHCL